MKRPFARGDRCVGAFDAGKLVGYVFFAFVATPDSGGVWVDFSERARYIYKSFVLPAYRGRRVGLELYEMAPRACPSQDRNLDIIIIHPDNLPSLRSAQSVGARPVGYVGYWKVAGRFLAFRSSGAKRHGFRFFKPGSIELQGAFLHDPAARLQRRG
jgi:GNAT superfamily N-acetyltransferase